MIIQTYHLLLVEDVPLLAKITEQMLKKSPSNKYTSVHKATLADALAALKTGEFDLILLDLNLPRKDFCRSILFRSKFTTTRTFSISPLPKWVLRRTLPACWPG